MDVGPSVVEEDNDELYLPRSKPSSNKSLLNHILYYTLYCLCIAAMNKLIKEIVPHLRVSVDSRDLLLKCSTCK